MEAKIILGGTDLALLDQLESRLTGRGYHVAKLGSVQDLLRQVVHYQPLLVIVVDDHPSLAWSAKKACHRVRELSKVLIMAVADEAGVLEMLRAGADDCVRLPLEWEEFEARIAALLRRTTKRGPPKHMPAILAEAGLWISFDTQEVNVHGKDLALTDKEFGVLAELVRNNGQVVSHDRLLAVIEADRENKRSGLVRQYIFRLRRKIERDPSNPQAIMTHRGVGYSFDAHGL